ncbi:TIGR03560 family F420-dependent LLM class oxidoreductase [Gordonia sp. (in: high G+C Gram-positive bacteria)]|uniref:TIGR03560 family F420-dependent LLM class oxidoreductase n=1 Tax=Gordonia sp. (in: high G+C Gram-positive bacteria) TaxID=84139 RepID=UPI003C793AD8
MELRIFTEPQQGATYDDLLAVAQATEELGFDAFFRSDHYLAMNSDGLPGPTDAWLTLAALATATSRIRLGTLVTSATFRHPGQLAIQAAQVDHMSGGRLDFGLGAGWFEEEHAAYGIPFPPLGERFDRLGETLDIVTGLCATPAGEMFDYAGKYLQITNSPGLPKPVQRPRPPIIIGGGGPVRTPRLAAKYADEFNVPFSPVEKVTDMYQRVDAACERMGRNRDEIVNSAALVLCCGRTEVEFTKRAAAIGREPAELRANGAAGTVDEVAAAISRYREVGASRIYLQVLDLADLEHLALVAEHVAPQLG